MPDRIVELDGVTHHFPGDATDAEIAAALGGHTAPTTDAPKWYQPGGDVLLDNVRAAGSGAMGLLRTLRDHPTQSLAMAGAAAAVPLTGGAALAPELGAAFLGGAGGAGIGRMIDAYRGNNPVSADPMAPTGVLRTMGVEGAKQAAVQAPGALLGAATRQAPRLMQSALKPTTALTNARAGAGYGTKESIAKAVLDEGRIVSPGSLANAQDALDTTDAAAHTAIQQGAGRGVTVDPFKVTAAIDRQGASTFGKQINAQPDTSAIQNVRDAFATNPYVSDPVTGMAPMPADLAHEFAINTGKNLKGKFGRLGGATVEAEKAGREAITSQLRDQIPELSPLWNQEARQITTRDALEQALNRTGNRDPIGLGGLVGAVKNPMLALTGMADRSAWLKSVGAQGLHRLPGDASQTLPNMIRAALLGQMGSEPAQQP